MRSWVERFKLKKNSNIYLEGSGFLVLCCRVGEASARPHLTEATAEQLGKKEGGGCEGRASLSP